VTDQAPPPHLDDEDLSALLDGEAGDGRAAAHLAACPSCSARRASLAGARDALRGATVAPLAGAVLDRLVATALEAPAEAVAPASTARVAPIGRGRGRRLSSPPPAWLVGAVASIAVLAGLAGLLRSGGGSDDDAGLSDVALRAEESGGDAFDQSTAENEAAAAVDPELVTADLGDVADAASLTAALDAPDTQAFSAGRTVAGDATSADADEAAEAAPTTGPAAPAGAGGSATAAGAPPDGARAQCRAEAEAAGGGRLGPLQATAVLRWEGRPAEVLVFALAEPADGFSRQALVLARPGCALLADPRF
jgi:hypothetical protein